MGHDTNGKTPRRKLERGRIDELRIDSSTGRENGDEVTGFEKRWQHVQEGRQIELIDDRTKIRFIIFAAEKRTKKEKV